MLVQDSTTNMDSQALSNQHGFLKHSHAEALLNVQICSLHSVQFTGWLCPQMHCLSPKPMLDDSGEDSVAQGLSCSKKISFVCDMLGWR